MESCKFKGGLTLEISCDTISQVLKGCAEQRVPPLSTFLLSFVKLQFAFSPLKEFGR